MTDVRVVGNETIGDTLILNTVRTRRGEPFDAETAESDVRRIFDLRRFRRVDARFAPTAGGVEVVFEVVELAPVEQIAFTGNRAIPAEKLRRFIAYEVGFRAGQRGDDVLLSLAAEAIERRYRDLNYALVRVDGTRDPATGVATFAITEGPLVNVRNIDFLGADSFGETELKKQIGTRIRWPLKLFGRDGTLDERQLEADVASLQQFYRQEKGYFDARVGRRIVWSPDLKEVQIEFLVDEGPRYALGDIEFTGLDVVEEAALRAAIAAVDVAPGQPFDAEKIRRATREIVKAYVPFGRVYQSPGSGGTSDPDDLRIRPVTDFRLEPGIVDLTFAIDEGKPFEVGRIRVRGNDKTQDKVLLRQFDLAPGQVYDSEAVERGLRRLYGLDYFQQVRVSPLAPQAGFADEEFGRRDLLIEVEEKSTALLSFGGSVSSNGGVFGQIKYDQRNFDIFDFPESAGDIFGEAFQGGGQRLTISLEPGTVRTNASINFFEPYFFDQNLGFGATGYYRTTRRREYRDTRGGGSIRLVPRIGRNLSTSISLRGEDVRIFDLDQPLADRAPEIVAARGHTTLTSVGLSVGYQDVDSRVETSRGYGVDLGFEGFGPLGGPTFQRLTASGNVFVPVYEDDRERKTVLEFRADGGAIYNDAPFFERFYAGGIGSIRGFRFRGVSPRSGIDDDPVGGDYSVTGTAAVGFPLVGEGLRGVVFSDFGSVDDDASLTTIRVSAGAGIRLKLEAVGNVPLAFDLAWPVNKRPEDEEQVFSFSLGILQ